jgi:hypothetical protein
LHSLFPQRKNLSDGYFQLRNLAGHRNEIIASSWLGNNSLHDSVFCKWLKNPPPVAGGGIREEHVVLGKTWLFINCACMVVISYLISRQTLKEPHAPEAVAAGDCVGVTILLELFGIDIFTW